MIMKNDKIKDEEEMTSFPNHEILENENIKNGKISNANRKKCNSLIIMDP